MNPQQQKRVKESSGSVRTNSRLIASIMAALAETKQKACGSNIGRGLLFASCLPLAAMAAADAGAVDLLSLDLEDLAKIEVKSAAALTKTDARRAPVTLSEIKAKTIQQSGARDINKLIESEVPNAQVVFHYAYGPQLGFRGMISDRADKFLYQVNGRTMNSRTITGADIERSLPLLGDIEDISVVRGPASATHGAGAISGVINVQTYTGMTYEGTEIAAKQSFVDSYTTGEVKFGKKLAEDTGVFLYYGQADIQGMDSDYYIGRTINATATLPKNIAGQPTPFKNPDLYAPGKDDAQRKLHVSVVKGPLEFWARYVEDGYTLRDFRNTYTGANPPTGYPAGTPPLTAEQWVTGRGIENKQLTNTLRFKKELSPTWTIDSMLSFDRYAYSEDVGARSNPKSRYFHVIENEIFARAIAVWSPNEQHSLGFGSDYSHEMFKFKGVNGGTRYDKWSADTLSFMAEHQWKLNDKFTLFTSGRTDKHPDTNWLISPRGTLVYTPNDKHTVKFMAGEAVRRFGDEELLTKSKTAPNVIPDPETLFVKELGYEYAANKEWTFGANVFHQNYSAIGWNGSASASLGEFEMAGLELMVRYRNADTRVEFSQGVVKLLDTELINKAFPAKLYQTVSADPYGGDDLLSWSTYISKITVLHDITPKLTASTSLTVYWGFDGAQDAAEFMNATYGNAPSTAQLFTASPRTDVGNDTPFGANVYWNVGLEYRPTPNWTLRLDGYNLADLFDDTISKRNYIFRMSEFSIESASVALSAKYKF